MKKDRLQNAVRTGAVLIKDGTPLPETLQVEGDPCLPGWRLVRDLNGYALDGKVRTAGWTFFCLAGEIKTIAFGSDERSTVRRATKRILADPRSKPFNSLEITRVASRRFLGLPYVSVGARARHVQESLALFSAQRIRESHEEESAATRTKVWGFASPEESGPLGTRRHVSVATAPGL